MVPLAQHAVNAVHLMLIFYGQGLNFSRQPEKISRMSEQETESRRIEESIEPASFSYRSPFPGRSPVLISVPHAGRHYPPEVRALSAVPLAALVQLEDRYADALVEGLDARGFGVIVAEVARATIDLNRDPRDIDRRMIARLPHGYAVIESAKSRGGLGLFPRSLPRVGNLWRGLLHWDQACARLASIHAPYHALIEQEMRAIRAEHGEALLLDVHSMPPLEAGRFAGEARPDVVIGDRFGASASARFSEIARSVVIRHGLHCVLNHPYPGTYVAERHGNPVAGRNVLQIEISRDLYLDAALRELGSGVTAIRAMVAELAETLADEAGRDSGLAIAAE